MRDQPTKRGGVFIALVALAGGCTGESTGDGTDDAGRSPDATVVEGGGPALDGGSRDAPDQDAAPSDGGTAFDAMCPVEPCDPRNEEGRCGIGKACVLGSTGPRCVSELGDLQSGDPCSSDAECIAGLTCFRSHDGGVCAQVCCPGDPEACGGEMRCSSSAVLVDGTETQWGRCMPPRECDVLRPVETCEPSEGCYIVAEQETGCRPAGDAEAGESCEAQNDCAPGFFCGGVSEGRCRRICSTDDSTGPSCPAGEGECRGYSQTPRGTGLCTDTSS